MGRRLESHRFRRRLAWGGVVVGVGAAIAGIALLTGTKSLQEAPVTDAPPSTYREPQNVVLTPALRRRFLATSIKFVQTAVTRENVDDAYNLVSPSLRTGFDRRRWHTGNIPVIPFPAAGLLSWDVAYSYTDDVALNLALVADKGSDTVGKTFMIELKRYGNRWLVESWVPIGVSGPGNVISLNKAVASTPEPKARLSAAWLLVPLGIFGLGLSVPIVLGVRGWRAGRRAVRAYEADRRFLDV